MKLPCPMPTASTTDDGDFINVIADIPATGAKIFGRLQANP